jgi:hypothetical protein
MNGRQTSTRLQPGKKEQSQRRSRATTGYVLLQDNTHIQLSQYLEIWDIIATLQLTHDQSDTISWTLTADGKYSASSAYRAQFVGSHPRFLAQKIWNASAEPKCKLFAWLALHEKLLTADMLVVRGWPHDSACRLCLSAPETATHLYKDCPFTMVIWNQVHTWDNADPGSPPSSYATTSKWWDTLIGGKTSTKQRRISGRLLYVIWNAWKERNRRIFNGKRLTYVEVASIARDDILQRERAFTVYASAILAEPD